MITIISRLNIKLNALEKSRELNCQFDALLISLFQNFEGFLNSRNRPISPLGNLSTPLFVNVHLKLRRTCVHVAQSFSGPSTSIDTSDKSILKTNK